MSPATPEEESVPPPGSPPVVPTFLLPPERVIITQPTPETEFPDDHGTTIVHHFHLVDLMLIDIFSNDQAEHMFDQNATIKETDEDEDDLASEMINVEPGTHVPFNSIRISSVQFFVIFFSATPTEEEGNNNGQVTLPSRRKVKIIQTQFNFDTLDNRRTVWHSDHCDGIHPHG